MDLSLKLNLALIMFSHIILYSQNVNVSIWVICKAGDIVEINLIFFGKLATPAGVL